MSDAGTEQGSCWPEQEAVIGWLNTHGIEVPLAAQRQLIEAVTRPRIEQQKRAEQAERERVAEARQREIGEKFHNVAVAERNYQLARAERLQREVLQVRESWERLRQERDRAERLQAEVEELREQNTALRAGKPLGPVVGAQALHRLEVERQRLLKALHDADDCIQEEFNLSNYDHDTVCRIAAMWDEAHGIIRDALTEPPAEQEDGWPGGVSDGLTLPCGVCGQTTWFDYTVSDTTWKAVAPDEHRLGVICLPCFDRLAERQGIDVSRSLEKVQFTSSGKTIILRPVWTHRYTARPTEHPSKARPIVVTCECGRGPRDIVEHEDDAGVRGWALANLCSDCLAEQSGG